MPRRRLHDDDDDEFVAPDGSLDSLTPEDYEEGENLLNASEDDEEAELNFEH